METKQKALEYLTKGLSVIPLQPKGKKALIGWTEFQNRKATEKEVDAWFSQWPEANIGIVTGKVSGIIVIDVDSEEAMKLVKNKNMPETPMVKTSKGYHFYCKYKEGVRNFQTRADLPGIDLRAEGGYVVAPPSIHESGHIYSWEEGKEFSRSVLIDLPEWVIAKNESERTPLAELYQGVSEPGRNNALARLVGSWANDGLGYDECLKNAFMVNPQNQPPMSNNEVMVVVKSIFEKHNREKETTHAKSPQFDSDANNMCMATEKKYFTINQLKNSKANNVDWIWEGYLAKGFITLLSGWPKAGKTTLLFKLIESMIGNQAFLDFKTKLDGKILIVTEENSQFYKVRVEKAGISSDDIFILPGFEVDCYTKNKVFEQIDLAIKDGTSLVIIDTLGEFWGVTDENSAPLVQEALKRFRTLAQNNNVAILLIHHLRKTDGDYGTAHRGSGALLGAVDVGLELKYSNDNVRNRRTITSKSRFHQTPGELMIELNEGNYQSLGDPKLFSLEEVKRRFIEALSADTSEDLETIRTKMKPSPSESQLKEVAKECRENGLVDVTGKGVKGNAYKYKIKTETS